MSGEYESIYKILARKAQELVDSADKIARTMCGGIYDKTMLVIALVVVMNRNRVEYEEDDIKEVKELEDFLLNRVIDLTRIGFSSKDFKEKLMEEWDNLFSDVIGVDLELEYYSLGRYIAKSNSQVFSSVTEAKRQAYKMLTSFEKYPDKNKLNSFCAGFINTCNEQGRIKLSEDTYGVIGNVGPGPCPTGSREHTVIVGGDVIKLQELGEGKFNVILPRYRFTIFGGNVEELYKRLEGRY